MKNKMIAALLGMGIALPATAANVNETVNDTSRVHDLDEVVVVSQSKEFLKLRHQPVSSTVVTAGEMSSMGARDLRSLSAFVPSFAMPDYGSRYTSAMYVRGIGARENSPAMGLYVDGLPVLNKSFYNSHFLGVERVDVLRGPQGTLYGMNTEGGLVRLYSKNPMNYQGTDVNIGVGSHFYRNIDATHYHKVSDRLAYSVGGYYSGTNGFFRNTTTGNRADDANEAGGKLRLMWNATERLSFDFIADYQWTRQHAFPYAPMDVESGRVAPVATTFEGLYHRNMLTTGLKIKYEMPWAELHSVTSYQFLRDNMLMDIDYLPQNNMHLQQRQLKNGIVEELTLKGKDQGRWHWTTGLYGSYQWERTDGPVFFDQGFNDQLSQTIHDAAYYPMLAAMAARMGEEAAKAMIKDAGGVHMDIRMGDVPGLFHTPHLNLGVFHESSFDLTDRLTAIAGLRYDYSRTKIDYCTSASMTGMMSVMGVTVNFSSLSEMAHSESNSFNQLLPKFGLTLRLDDTGSNLYATVTKGYRAGGFNFQMFSDILRTEVDDPRLHSTRKDLSLTSEHTEADYENIRNTISYKPETSWNYELGAHLNLFDNRLHFDISTFYMDTRNQQLSVMANDYGYGRMMVNAGKSRSCGFETALRGSAFDNHLSYTAGYGLTFAAFREYDDSVMVDGKNVLVSYKDNRVPYIPQHTLSLLADYRLDFANSVLRSITLGANLQAMGRIYWDAANSVSQPFYALLGAHVAADFGKATVNLWARNLTDTRFNTFALNNTSSGSYFAQEGAPFCFGVDVALHF